MFLQVLESCAGKWEWSVFMYKSMLEAGHAATDEVHEWIVKVDAHFIFTAVFVVVTVTHLCVFVADLQENCNTEGQSCSIQWFTERWCAGLCLFQRD